MVILRNKNYSGYQPTFGTSYKQGSAQLKQGIDDGIVRTADILDDALDKTEGVHPVVDKVSNKWRNRIKGYTKPLKVLHSKKKVKE